MSEEARPLRMRPLQAVACGVLLHLLFARLGGYDVLADPLGWVLVLVGLRALPPGFELRSSAIALAVLALVTSVPLWVPGVASAVEDADESLAWAVDLPRFGCYLVLALALSRVALAAGDRGAAGWWSTVVLALAAVVVLPVLVFGGGIDGLAPLATTLVGLVPTVVLVLLLVHAGRPWAAAEVDVIHPGGSRDRNG
ncbi:hypothetical protein [Nocardioides litoris]|uniref:hypothetical protein n=1 Tax=Nocardioides litoris TaxID=1926648 RepID=UPI00112265DC|nr:hypothetical protein [Nocardioides litoris]